ncbi:MAG: Fur family transcriptional regulator [Cumulibacter sp.]
MAEDRRRTAQQERVKQSLDEADGFVSAGDLHRRIFAKGESIGLATVYRHLNAMAEREEIDVIAVDNERLFRACASADHHHHLVCERCGKAVDLPPPEEAWFADVAGRHGFTLTRHVLEIFGVCAECAAASR